mgnify:CR=1 FL=1
MTKIHEQTTQTEQPVATKPPMGTKAFDMIRNTVRAGLRYHSGVKNLSGMRVSVVRFLVPDGNGFIPCNCDGYRIGQTEPNLSIGREWIIAKRCVEEASHMGLTIGADGVVDLFVRGVAPWAEELFFKNWASKLCVICGFDYGAMFRESCRPQGKVFGSNSSILHD